MRLLFVKHSLAWPRSSGHDVHTYHLMRALCEAGHEISLATLVEPTSEAISGLALRKRIVLPATNDLQLPRLDLTKLQERFRSYWGISQTSIFAVGEAARSMQVDGVVAVGLDAPPLLAAVKGPQRIWYAGDELAWHHLSLVQPLRTQTWPNFREAIVKGLYERAFRGHMDRVWVVSFADRRAMRLVAGVRQVDIIPNGVDTDHFHPMDVPQRENSCVFWGRLDFEPNIQALDWFCHEVWPKVRQAVPESSFQIFGFRSTPPVERLAQGDGIELQTDLPDIRDGINRQQVVVMPFRSGGGVKNKLLEAASLGKPILCTNRVRNGLNGVCDSRMIFSNNARSWANELAGLWGNAKRRNELGSAARNWVKSHHSWHTSADIAINSLTNAERS